MCRGACIFLLQCVIFYKWSLADPLVGANIEPVDARQFSFVVSIGNSSETRPIKHICTGSLISDQHVLTSEHCLQNDKGKLLDYNNHDLHVLVGTHNLLSGGRRIEISSWITYVQWAPRQDINPTIETEYDIAVLKLSSKVKDIKPGTLSTLTTEQLLKGPTKTTAGWGVGSDGHVPTILQTARVQVISAENCQRNMREFNPIVELFGDVFICTNGTTLPYTFLEDGDSGGPLMDEKDEIVGVNMATWPGESEKEGDHGYRPGRDEQFVVNLHMRIQHFRSFIEAAMRVL